MSVSRLQKSVALQSCSFHRDLTAARRYTTVKELGRGAFGTVFVSRGRRDHITYVLPLHFLGPCAVFDRCSAQIRGQGHRLHAQPHAQGAGDPHHAAHGAQERGKDGRFLQQRQQSVHRHGVLPGWRFKHADEGAPHGEEVRRARPSLLFCNTIRRYFKEDQVLKWMIEALQGLEYVAPVPHCYFVTLYAGTATTCRSVTATSSPPTSSWTATAPSSWATLACPASFSRR